MNPAFLWKIPGYFLVTTVCGLLNAIAVVVLSSIVDDFILQTFQYSPIRALESCLERLLGLKVDPLADTLPAFLFIAVLAYGCGCLFGHWLYVKWVERRSASSHRLF